LCFAVIEPIAGRVTNAGNSFGVTKQENMSTLFERRPRRIGARVYAGLCDQPNNANPNELMQDAVIHVR
jgi:hypothetical protein